MIRDATLDDVPTLVALCRGMHAESPRFGRLRFDAEKLGMVFRNLVALPGGFAKVAEETTGTVGCMLAVMLEHWGSPDLVATDLVLYVLPGHRGGLNAPRLANAYRQWARRGGAVHINLGVSAGIEVERTVALYERLGFARCGVILEA